MTNDDERTDAFRRLDEALRMIIVTAPKVIVSGPEGLRPEVYVFLRRTDRITVIVERGKKLEP